MALDLEAEVALLEEHRRIVAAEHRVAQAGLQAVPARRQRAGDVADVLVVHAEHRAEAVRLHALARALQAVLAQPVPVDALLPVESRDSEIRSHVAALQDESGKLKAQKLESESRSKPYFKLQALRW